MLKVKNFTIDYSNKELTGLNNLNFELPSGAICLVLGESDISKSVCLALAGLLLHAQPEATVSGIVEWDNKSISQKEFNPGTAMTLENPYAQLTGLKRSVLEEIAFGLEMRGVPREEMKQRIHAAANTFEISHLLPRNPGMLSGGEIQRTVIACSHALWPELWILDRPLTELDPLARLRFLQTLKLLADERGTLIVMAEEPSPDIYSIATHTLTIRADRAKLSMNTQRKSNDEVDVSSLPSAINFVKKKYTNYWSGIKGRPSIQIKGLSFQYSLEHTMIFENLDLSVDPGECLWITGANGSGKTTLAKIIAGILKPQKGEILLDGINYAKEREWKIARHIAYAFQNPDLQIFCRDVWSEVSFGPKSLGYSKDRYETLTGCALSMFGLSGKEKHHPHDLNRSERKRLGLAAAFAMDTPIVILDEPTQFQTREWKEVIREAICERLKEGTTLLVVTHELDFIW